MEQVTRFKVGNSSLVLDKQNGAKILELVLDGVPVITSN